MEVNLKEDEVRVLRALLNGSLEEYDAIISMSIPMSKINNKEHWINERKIATNILDKLS